MMGARHLVLTGPMGVGKTAVGAALAAQLGWPFVDSDAEIAAAAGRSGKEIAATRGIAHLHEMEAATLRRAVRTQHATVIAGAASVAGDAALLEEAIRHGATIVYLQCDPAELARRVAQGGHRRPIADAEAAAFAEQRHRNLVAVAALTVDTTGGDVVEIVGRILAQLGWDGPVTR